jgi:hypothetical protein
MFPKTATILPVTVMHLKLGTGYGECTAVAAAYLYVLSYVLFD